LETGDIRSGLVDFQGASASAVVPAGVKCSVEVFNIEYCFEASLVATRTPNTCVPVGGRAVSWTCDAPPPLGYPKAKVTIFNTPGCLISALLSTTYYNVPPNKCQRCQKIS